MQLSSSGINKSHFDKLVSESSQKEALREDDAALRSIQLDENSKDFRELEREEKVFAQKFKQDDDTHDLRKKYIGRIFWLIVLWLIFVATCIALEGWHCCSDFTLSDTVLVAFITSTTINVIGLFIVVAKWLYPDGNQS